MFNEIKKNTDLILFLFTIKYYFILLLTYFLIVFKIINLFVNLLNLKNGKFINYYSERKKQIKSRNRRIKNIQKQNALI